MTRVAIAHDYLTQFGGAERVVLSIHKAFPDAEIHTSFYDEHLTYPEFGAADVRPHLINRVTPLRTRHRAALPLLAGVMETTRVEADVVVCSSSGWAHGVRTEGRKVVYCHNPARWLYQTETYVETMGALPRAAITVLGPLLRRWDQRAAAGCAEYLANSSVVAERIARHYGRRAPILPPPPTLLPGGPVEPVPGAPQGYALCVSRLMTYKNVRQVVEAFRGLPEMPLVIVGEGPLRDELTATAPSNVHLVGRVSDDQLRGLYAGADLLVAASYEDFGLTPLEAAGFGKPAAVLRYGGFLDTLEESRTGEFFDTPEPEQIAKAVTRVATTEWDAALLRRHAHAYSEERFIQRLRRQVLGT